MSELHDLLDRTTDRIEATDGHGRAAAALARAGVVRRRRRGIAAAAAVATVVAGVAVVSGITGSDKAGPPIAPSPDIPAVPTSAVQPVFDPRMADELPLRETGFPATMVPPENLSALPLTEPAALVLWGEGATLYLLTEDGQWATTRTPAGAAFGATLNPAGTLLASFEVGALHVTDVRDGQWREIALPEEWPTTPLPTQIHWLSDDEVVLWAVGTAMAWSVPLDGSAPPREHKLSTVRADGYAVSPDGVEIEFGTDSDAKPIIAETRAGETLRSLGARSLGILRQLTADADQAVAIQDGVTAGISDGGSLIVLDREDGYAPTALLPIEGWQQVTPVGWLDEGTVLLEWSDPRNNWVLVAWEIESGQLTRVATGTNEAQVGP